MTRQHRVNNYRNNQKRDFAEQHHPIRMVLYFIPLQVSSIICSSHFFTH